MDRLYQATHRLRLDPRWEKSTLPKKDLDKLALLITGLQQLHGMASKSAATDVAPEEKTA